MKVERVAAGSRHRQWNRPAAVRHEFVRKAEKKRTHGLPIERIGKIFPEVWRTRRPKVYAERVGNTIRVNDLNEPECEKQGGHGAPSVN